ncbi:MAG TPA: hypothetical protein VF657_01515, partial [Actinoplanes sp.]
MRPLFAPSPHRGSGLERAVAVPVATATAVAAFTVATATATATAVAVAVAVARRRRRAVAVAVAVAVAEGVVRVFEDGGVMEAVRRSVVAAVESAETPVWPLSVESLVESLDGVETAERSLAATKLHLIREIDGR